MPLEVTVRPKPVLLTLSLLLLMLPTAARTQQAPPSMPFPPQPGPPSLPEIESRPDAQQTRLERERVKAANRQRQERLKEDTNKLLKLATQLKTEVDKSNADILSVEVIKKADEIEKLAHSVKEKMKGD
jgi:hypothetical protein